MITGFANAIRFSVRVETCLQRSSAFVALSVFPPLSCIPCLETGPGADFLALVVSEPCSARIAAYVWMPVWQFLPAVSTSFLVTELLGLFPFLLLPPLSSAVVIRLPRISVVQPHTVITISSTVQRVGVLLVALHTSASCLVVGIYFRRIHAVLLRFGRAGRIWTCVYMVQSHVPSRLATAPYGADEGSRTPISRLEVWCSTVELHPQRKGVEDDIAPCACRSRTSRLADSNHSSHLRGTVPHGLPSLPPLRCRIDRTRRKSGGLFKPVSIVLPTPDSHGRHVCRCCAGNRLLTPRCGHSPC